MRKMTPDQAAALKSFYQFIASGDDVLREEAYKMVDAKLKRNQELKRAAKKAKMEAVKVESPKKDLLEVIESIQSRDNSQEISQAPKKRGRKPLTEEQKQERLAAKQSATAPKKRGRKPKVQAVAVLEESVVPKKRGRPKKVASEVVETIQEVVVAKRGRKPLTADQKQERLALKQSQKLADKAPLKKRGRKSKVELAQESPKMFKDLRNKLNLNQKQMAAVLGVSQGLVCQVELGKVTPQDDLVSKVQKMLKTL